MTRPRIWAESFLEPGPGRRADVNINGYPLECEITSDDAREPRGPTAFGLLAASLSACTAMSARTFLERWGIAPSATTVHVGFEDGSPPVMHRHVTVTAALSVDMREQLAAVVDSTPVTVLIRDGIPIRTRITTGPAAP